MRIHGQPSAHQLASNLSGQEGTRADERPALRPPDLPPKLNIPSGSTAWTLVALAGRNPHGLAASAAQRGVAVGSQAPSGAQIQAVMAKAANGEAVETAIADANLPAYLAMEARITSQRAFAKRNDRIIEERRIERKAQAKRDAERP